MIDSQKRCIRGTQADSIDADFFNLVKLTSVLRATYQIRLLTFFATQERKRLMIHIPMHCSLHRTLSELMNSCPGVIVISRRENGTISYRV
jgi:hypothetical protein